MKAIIFNFLFCLFFFNPAFAERISGLVINLKKPQIILRSYPTFLASHDDTLMVAFDGSFSRNIKLESPGFIELVIGGYAIDNIYIGPNEDLVVSADGKNWNTFFETVKFKGSAAPFNNYLSYVNRNLRRQNMFITMETYHFEQKKFLSTVVEVYKTRDSLASRYLSKLNQKELSSRKWMTFKKIDSIQNLYEKLSVYRSFAAAVIKPWVEKQKFVSEYVVPLIKVTEMAEYLAAPHYRYFWVDYLELKYDLKNSQVFKEYKHNKMDYFKALPDFKQKEVNDRLSDVVDIYYLSNIPKEYVAARDSDFVILDTFVNKLVKHLSDKTVGKNYFLVASKVSDFSRTSRPGKQAKDFQMEDKMGKTYTLKDFKGKLVVIDVWASWCIPCIKEIPALKTMSEKYVNNGETVFISVSVDEFRKDWIEKGLSIPNLENKQFWANGGFESLLAKQYAITSVPRFIIIDRDGLIINIDGPKPSQISEFSDMMEQALSGKKK